MKFLRNVLLSVALIFTSLTAFAASHNILVSWNPVTTRLDGTAATVDHYEIWRSSGGNSPSFFGDVAPAGATSLSIAGFLEGNTYNFQVRAIAVNGTLGTLNAPVSVTVPLPETNSSPSAPTGVTATVQ